LARLLDRDENGLTSFDLSNNTKSMRRVMERLDLDENSVLSSDEVYLAVEPLAEADVDNNGVTRRELAVWLLAWRKQLRRDELQ
jgi:hypothetical protein